MYEAVHLGPNTDTTPSRFGSVASRFGFDGLVIFGDCSATERDRIAQAFEIDVIHGSLIPAQNQDAVATAIQQHREHVEVLAVRAHDPGLQPFLSNRTRLDVIDPTEVPAHTTAKAADNHGIWIAINLAPLIHSEGSDRTAAIRDLRTLVDIILQYDLRFVVSAGAQTHFDLRAPRELRALGRQVGLSASEVDAGLRAWGTIADRTRRIRDDNFIEPGVHVENNDTTD